MDLVIKNLTKEQSDTIAAFAHAVKEKSIEEIQAFDEELQIFRDKFLLGFYCDEKYRIKPSPSYLELHQESGFEVGDTVRITTDYVYRDFGYEFTRLDQDLQGYKTYEGKITYDEGEKGFWIDGDKLLPYYVLELVKKKPKEEWG